MRTPSWLAAGLLTAVAAGVLAAPMTAASAASDAGGADAFTYTGTWGGTAPAEKWSTTANSTATATLDVAAGGSTVSIYGNTDTGGGIAKVQVDSGTAVTVDTYNSTPPPGVDKNWYTTSSLAAGRHTVKVTVTGTKRAAATGPAISIKGVNLPNGSIVWPGSTSTPPPSTGTPSSTDTSKFTSSGTWTKESASKWYSNATGAYVTVPVTIGTGGGTVTVKGTKADNYGFGAFSVDGGTETKVDLYATTRVEGTNIWTSPTLTAGQHTIKVRVDGTKRTAATDRYVAVAGASTTNGTFGTSTTTPTEPTTPPPSTNPIDSPVAKEKALEITSTAENSTVAWWNNYGYIEDIGDDRGYTAGLVGWTSSGDMYELIRRYSLAVPGNPLSSYQDELLTLRNEGMSSNAGNRADQLLGTTFINLWKTEATKASFQQAQKDERDRTYWTMAHNEAITSGVGVMGQAILYDIAVNHGSGDDWQSFQGIVRDAKAVAKPPSAGGSEKAYLTALNDKRRAALVAWGDDQAGGRADMWAAFIATNNFSLTTPLSWKIYGDTFSWASDPTPR